MPDLYPSVVNKALILKLMITSVLAEFRGLAAYLLTITPHSFRRALIARSGGRGDAVIYPLGGVPRAFSSFHVTMPPTDHRLAP